MNMTAYIVDDEYHGIVVLEEYIGRTPGLTLAGFSTNPLEALEAISGVDTPDLLFLDIEMPDLSGLEMAGLVGGHTRIVLTTSHREFGPEAFDMQVLDYLLKPVSYARFLMSVQKARHKQEQDKPYFKSRDYFFVKTESKGKFTKIFTDEIRYIEGALNYINIFLSDETIMTYLTLKEVLQKLPENQFCRIHQSYIVNHHYIKSVEQHQVRLADQRLLPLGRGFREAFFKRLNPALLLSGRDLRS